MQYCSRKVVHYRTYHCQYKCCMCYTMQVFKRNYYTEHNIILIYLYIICLLICFCGSLCEIRFIWYTVRRHGGHHDIPHSPRHCLRQLPPGKTLVTTKNSEIPSTPWSSLYITMLNNVLYYNNNIQFVVFIVIF